MTQYKSTRRLDGQGRVIIPAHIREQMDLHTNSLVELVIKEDGSVLIRPTDETCCLCGASVEGKHHVALTAEKHICSDCATKIAKAMLK